MSDLPTVMLGPQVTYLKSPPNMVLMEDIRNPESIFPKPRGGLWTSSQDTHVEEGWTYFTTVDYVGATEGRCLYRLEPLEPVFQISTLEDLETLIGRYPRPTGIGVQHSSYMPMWHVDWEAMEADGYAGVNLTTEGQWATRFSTPSLYGWDCESTIWLRWVFGGPSDWAELLHDHTRGHALEVT